MHPDLSCCWRGATEVWRSDVAFGMVSPMISTAHSHSSPWQSKYNPRCQWTLITIHHTQGRGMLRAGRGMLRAGRVTQASKPGEPCLGSSSTPPRPLISKTKLSVSSFMERRQLEEADDPVSITSDKGVPWFITPILPPH